jgi:hypothetical protein
VRASNRVRTIALLVGLWVAVPAGAGWETKQFRVISAERLPGAAGPLLVPLFNAVASQLDAWLSAWGMDPTNARVYVPDPQVRQEIEEYLGAAAGLMESWGFPQPALPVRSGRYEVVLAAALPNPATLLKGRELHGAYHPQVCGVIGSFIILNANSLLDKPGETGDGNAGVLTVVGRETLGHELFHAVQGNTAFGSRCGAASSAGSWIMEGTAQAVGLDVLRRLRGEESEDWAWGWGARDYSRRLPVFRPVPLVDKADIAAYTTGSFWRYLAELSASGGALPGPEQPGLRLDYGYLARLLQRPGPFALDCVGASAPCDAELRWLDARLQDVFGRSLGALYPLFAETLARYGESRVQSQSPGRDWRNKVFNPCVAVGLAPKPRSARVFRTLIPNFEPVSMRCWEIGLVPFWKAGRDRVLVQVSVDAPPGGIAIADLAGAVAGPPIRAERVVQETDPATGGISARWTIELPTSEDGHFVLTNVAPDPGATTRMENLPITFTVIDPYATIVTSTAASPRITSTPGPSGADVDQPIPVHFDRGLQAMLSNKAPRADRAQNRYAGLESPCSLVVGLSNTRGDQMSIVMNHDGPVGPGDFPLADATKTGYGKALPPGQPVIGFVFGANNLLSGGQPQAFEGTSGLMTVTSISGRFVQGVVQVNGVNRLAKRIALGDPQPLVYVPNATIRVEFGLVMRDAADPTRNRGASACLTTASGR